jgi:hypothetical protein
LEYGSGAAGTSSGAYDPYNNRLESPPGGEAAGQDKSMADFFSKTEELQSNMNQIRAKQQELWKMHEQSKSIVRRNEIIAHREQMQVRSNISFCVRLSCQGDGRSRMSSAVFKCHATSAMGVCLQLP